MPPQHPLAWRYCGDLFARLSLPSPPFFRAFLSPHFLCAVIAGTSRWAALYFIAFWFVVIFTVLNLVVAFIVEGIEEATKLAAPRCATRPFVDGVEKWKGVLCVALARLTMHIFLLALCVRASPTAGGGAGQAGTTKQIGEFVFSEEVRCLMMAVGLCVRRGGGVGEVLSLNGRHPLTLIATHARHTHARTLCLGRRSTRTGPCGTWSATWWNRRRRRPRSDDPLPLLLRFQGRVWICLS